MPRRGPTLGDPTDFSYRINKVTKIIDGDTIDVILDLGFDILHKSRVRLFGIDTPESRTRNKEEKKRLQKQRDESVTNRSMSSPSMSGEVLAVEEAYSTITDTENTENSNSGSDILEDLVSPEPLLFHLPSANTCLLYTSPSPRD